MMRKMMDKGVGALICFQTVYVKSSYSRTSVARTLMARLPRLFRTRS